jgi:hypothetical protein
MHLKKPNGRKRKEERKKGRTDYRLRMGKTTYHVWEAINCSLCVLIVECSLRLLPRAYAPRPRRNDNGKKDNATTTSASQRALCLRNRRGSISFSSIIWMNFTYYFRPSPPRLRRCSLVVQRISNLLIYKVKKFYCIKGSW